MNFPAINGVDEGSVAILIMSIISGLSGDNEKFWKQDLWIPVYNDYMPAN